MPKNTNQKTFKYRVIETLTDDGFNYTTLYRFKTTKEITDKFEIPRNSIYHILNNKPTYKYSHIKIMKINEPAYIILDQ
jgi:hypothetical protein